MTKRYKINVDCANCAAKMEEAIKQLGGVDDASISFMTQKLRIDFADGADEDAVMAEVISTCKGVEDDVSISR